MANFSELPEEIILVVLNLMDVSDLTRVVRVCRDLFRIGGPCIWRDLEEVPANPHFCSLLSAETVFFADPVLVRSLQLGLAYSDPDP